MNDVYSGLLESGRNLCQVQLDESNKTRDLSGVLQPFYASSVCYFPWVSLSVIDVA